MWKTINPPTSLNWKINPSFKAKFKIIWRWLAIKICVFNFYAWKYNVGKEVVGMWNELEIDFLFSFLVLCLNVNHQHCRVLQIFYTFIFWILSNLVKYTYGWVPFEKHHKIEKKSLLQTLAYMGEEKLENISVRQVNILPWYTHGI